MMCAWCEINYIDENDNITKFVKKDMILVYKRCIITSYSSVGIILDTKLCEYTIDIV